MDPSVIESLGFHAALGIGTEMIALEGVKVLDVSQRYPGPFCTMLLADVGAEVLKIEQPGTGDPGRAFPAFFDSVNRNKRSLTLDLKRPAGKEIFYKLAKKYDVVTEGFRPGVAKKLKIDIETLRNINSRLIYCSISGYGQDGPYRDLPGHDINYQAISGILECFLQEDGTPIYPNLMMADHISGILAAFGISIALLAREKTGMGQYIDCSMSDALLSCMAVHIQHYYNAGEMFGSRDAGYGTFRTADGQWISLGIVFEDLFWDRLCDVLGLHELKGLNGVDRLRKQKDLTRKIQDILLTKKRDEWLDALAEAEIPVSPVNKVADVVKDPQVAAREMIQDIVLTDGKRLRQVAFPLKLSATPARIIMAPPGIGEHKEQVLRELGYDRTQIEKLEQGEVI
jgi:crotonobetainyl-CoA:carnitine CoA-transferase CaiB-like acyl-CoA transferase